VKKSLEYLDRAVEIDPNYALAWAAKATAHGDIVSHTDSSQHENFQMSTQAIEKALAIDPNLSEAYSARCHNKNRYDWDPVGAEIACRRAIELDPNSPVAHKTFANFLYSRGRFDEAIYQIKTAMDLQPVSYRNQQMYGLTLYFAQRFDEAEAHFKHLIELNPNHTFIHTRLIKVLEEEGKESEAFEYLNRMLSIEKRETEAERFKTAYRTSGWRGVLIERIKSAEANAPRGNFQLACLYAKVGDKDKAFENLEIAYRERSFQIAVLQVEPQLQSLHDDPRFADLIRRIDGK
jgi:tetratricopeptide (TPR) repeat protein